MSLSNNINPSLVLVKPRKTRPFRLLMGRKEWNQTKTSKSRTHLSNSWVCYALAYSKTCLKRPLKKKTQNGLNIDYRLMEVKPIAKCYKGDHSAILSTFIKLPFVTKIFVLSIFEWQLILLFEYFLLGLLSIGTM